MRRLHRPPPPHVEPRERGQQLLHDLGHVVVQRGQELQGGLGLPRSRLCGQQDHCARRSGHRVDGNYKLASKSIILWVPKVLVSFVTFRVSQDSRPSISDYLSELGLNLLHFQRPSSHIFNSRYEVLVI